MRQLDDDDVDAAWKDLLAAYRLGRLLSTRPTLQETLVGYFCQRDVMHALLEFLQRAGLDAAQLHKCRQDLAALPPHSSIREKANLAERFMYLDMVTGTAMHAKGHGITGITILWHVQDAACKFGTNSIDWDVALLAGNLWFDRLVRALEIPGYAARQKRLKAIETELAAIRGPFKDDRGEFSTTPIPEPAWSELKGAERRLAKELASYMSKRVEADPDRNKTRDAGFARALANLAASTMLPHLIRAHAIEMRLQQSQLNLEVAFALAEFRARHGRYPKTLDELTRDRLPPADPIDLFSGKPLVYRPQGDGYHLYSFGKGYVDNAFSTLGDDLSAYPLSVQVEH